MREAERLTQPTGEFSTWEEFEASMDRLVEKYEHDRYQLYGDIDPLPTHREILYEKGTYTYKEMSTVGYYCEFDELGSGFFIRIRGSKHQSAEPDLWPLIDTTPVLGSKLANVSECILRFNKSNEEAGERAKMSLLVNPSLDEHIEGKKINPTGFSRRRYLTAGGLKRMIEESNPVGDLPVRHPSRPDINFAERVRNIAYLILR